MIFRFCLDENESGMSVNKTGNRRRSRYECSIMRMSVSLKHLSSDEAPRRVQKPEGPIDEFVLEFDSDEEALAHAHAMVIQAGEAFFGEQGILAKVNAGKKDSPEICVQGWVESMDKDVLLGSFVYFPDGTCHFHPPFGANGGVYDSERESQGSTERAATIRPAA